MHCSSVKISASGISQLNGDRIVADIPREGIVRITLGHDSRSRHPFLRFLAGFVLVVTGIVFGIGAFLLDLGGVYLARLGAVSFGIPVAPLIIVLLLWSGGWLVLGMLKGRYNLLIHTQKGPCKIFFEDAVDVREIDRFLKRAQAELGYEIDTSLMQQMHFKS